METYDLYIKAKKPGIGLYVRHGAPLPGSLIRTTGGSTAKPPRICRRLAWSRRSPPTATAVGTWTSAHGAGAST